MIYLIRHARAVHNEMLNTHGSPILRSEVVRDAEVCDKGYDQIKVLVRNLRERGITFSYIYTSPLSRTVQTAVALLEGSVIGTTIKAVDLLKEFGNEYMPNMRKSKSDLIELYPSVDFTDISIADPYADVDDEVDSVERLDVIHQFIEGLKVNNTTGTDTDIAVVTHSGIIKKYISKYYPEIELKKIRNCDYVVI